MPKGLKGFQKGHPCYTPLKLSEETKEKIRKTIKKLGIKPPCGKGSLNSNYKDGRSINKKEYLKKWQKENLDKTKEYSKKWRIEHPQEYKESCQKHNQKYYQNHKKEHSFRNLERRRRENGAEGSHTFGEWELLKKQYGFTCANPECKKSEPEIILTEDHIIPLIKGGSDFIENIQPLCRSCNAKKHTKIIKY